VGEDAISDQFIRQHYAGLQALLQRRIGDIQQLHSGAVDDGLEQICRSLGLPPLHFDKVICRARQRLRALLEARGFSKSDLLGVLLVCFV
jgi:hypothetical protein